MIEIYIKIICTILIPIGAAIDDCFMSNLQSMQCQIPATKINTCITKHSVRNNVVAILRQNFLSLKLWKFSRLYKVKVDEKRTNSFKTIIFFLFSMILLTKSTTKSLKFALHYYAGLESESNKAKESNVLYLAAITLLNR